WAHLPEGIQSERGARCDRRYLWCQGISKSSPWRALDSVTMAWGRAWDRPELPFALASAWPDRGEDRKPAFLVAWLDAKVVASRAGWMLLGPEYLWELDSRGTPIRGQGGFGYLTAVAEWPGP
ncbi:MAG: hypothetical protein KDB61_14030, partial [Planctomycetes bacterium]|nr:hypothetical protein [Planctomycetota bacterium]